MKQLVRTNASVNWDDFVPDTYREKYLRRPGPEDRWVVEMALKHTKTFASQYGHSTIAQAADVGTGPSLLLPMVMAPYVRELDLVEPGRQNAHYLRRAIGNPQLAQADWQEAEAYISSRQDAQPEHASSLRLLAERACVRQYGLTEVDASSHQLLMTCFCAESATESKAECLDFIHTTVRAVRPGGLFFGAYIEHSRGYPDYDTGTTEGSYNARKFPAADLDIVDLEHVFAGSGIAVTACPISTRMRKGYSRVLIATGRRR
jgi:hypothetical protein